MQHYVIMHEFSALCQLRGLYNLPTVSYRHHLQRVVCAIEQISVDSVHTKYGHASVSEYILSVFGLDVNVLLSAEVVCQVNRLICRMKWANCAF